MEGLSEQSPDVHSQGEISREWCGGKYPKNEVIFYAQTLLVYIVSIASIANLSFGSPLTSLWICLLSSTIGYMLPNPKMKKTKSKE